MHVHLVYCHPSEESLTAEIRTAFIRGLLDSDKTFSLSDLYTKDFKTDMTEEEYLRDAFYNDKVPLSSDVLEEQELINLADAIVFMYPVFWTEAPAKLVGWFDRVWSYGFAYGGETPAHYPEIKGAFRAASSMKKLDPMKVLDKALVIATAGNTKETLYEQGRLQAMEKVMLDDRIHERALHKEFILLGGTERSNPELRESMRAQHLKTAYDLAKNL